MKKLTIRVVSLAAVLSLLFLASCASGTTGGTEETLPNSPAVSSPDDAPAETEPRETEPAGPTLSFDKQDYGAISFHILTCSEADYEYLAEELTGERVNDAIFARNRNAEEYLNLVLDVIYERGDWDSRDSYNNIIRSSIMAGDSAYDYVTGMIMLIPRPSAAIPGSTRSSAIIRGALCLPPLPMKSRKKYGRRRSTKSWKTIGKSGFRAIPRKAPAGKRKGRGRFLRRKGIL